MGNVHERGEKARRSSGEKFKGLEEASLQAIRLITICEEERGRMGRSIETVAKLMSWA